MERTRGCRGRGTARFSTIVTTRFRIRLERVGVSSSGRGEAGSIDLPHCRSWPIFDYLGALKSEAPRAFSSRSSMRISMSTPAASNSTAHTLVVPLPFLWIRPPRATTATRTVTPAGTSSSTASQSPTRTRTTHGPVLAAPQWRWKLRSSPFWTISCRLATRSDAVVRAGGREPRWLLDVEGEGGQGTPGIRRVTIVHTATPGAGLSSVFVFGSSRDSHMELPDAPCRMDVVLGGTAQAAAGQCGAASLNIRTGREPRCTAQTFRDQIACR